MTTTLMDEKSNLTPSQQRVQQKWQDLQILHHDAVAYGDGNVTLGHSYYTEDRDGKIDYYWSPLCDTTVEGLEKYDEECWVAIDLYRSKAVYGDQQIVCGDGAMGNEGFVASVDKQGLLNWSIFFEFSNPINKVEVIEDTLICYGDTGVIVRINLTRLHDIDIEYNFY